MQTDKVRLFAADSLLGRSEEHARMLAIENRKRMRIMRRDGQQMIGTTDYNPDRINVAVEQGKVVAILNNG